MIAFAACSGDNGSSLTSPGSGGGNGGGYGNGGGGTGGTGGNTGGTPASGDVAVIVGNNFMKSGHNGSVNPAVDTVAIGGSVTWTWTNTGNVPHGIQSLGSPLFRNGTVLTGNGSTYRVTFNTAGTYQYDCVVHGAMMSGTIVVQ
ncbi:MAG TPA: plastocyanin/azurin family copper-binding protein [Gemmatimonadales bacterium]|nr:plastocyanin/azurin family copper-binding protein [Gemmatimonadales bacterium]